MTKLLLYKSNFRREQFSQFPNLSTAEKKDEDIPSYYEQLGALQSDFNQRFDDIEKMTISDWILDPFSSANTKESLQLQELMEVTTNG